MLRHRVAYPKPSKIDPGKGIFAGVREDDRFYYLRHLDL